MNRKASVTRKTKETNISISIDLDGKGVSQIQTGNGMLDHLLDQISRHGLVDLTVSAVGDIQTGWHHTVEDIGITLGQAIRQAIGEGEGIRRVGSAMVPMDETLAQVVIDVGGRAYSVIEVALSQDIVGDLPGDLVRHFLEALSSEGRLTLHAQLLYGVNPHHKAEAVFKALGRALRLAVELDPRMGKTIPSTKGTISR